KAKETKIHLAVLCALGGDLRRCASSPSAPAHAQTNPSPASFSPPSPTSSKPTRPLVGTFRRTPCDHGLRRHDEIPLLPSSSPQPLPSSLAALPHSSSSPSLHGSLLPLRSRSQTLVFSPLRFPSRSRSAPSLAAPSNAEAETEAVPIEKQFPPFPTVMDINQIREILPHRFPFLLVDRVIEYTPGVTAVGIKNVTINDNFFPGHFPERPIMPGVLMVEAMAQVGGLVMLQPEVGGSRENFFFAGIDKVRFRKPVIAGDTLVMRMTLIKLQKRFGIAKMEGKAYVGGEVVCEGEFLMATGTGSE
ncbi:3-hydroxyacyl-[acyl-carrier-protein] dehydratase FabZ-like, partial [Dioscorea cayenensis subsp. rotundata]|uniref:3-hydroxyacyl-[acyl-carrier-protein] dehydratase n=1 Tax=Dioscorea cayennensis subsp. rotundata TaxID=55577 RepID=A0AB40C240_DIOCR